VVVGLDEGGEEEEEGVLLLKHLMPVERVKTVPRVRRRAVAAAAATLALGLHILACGM